MNNFIFSCKHLTFIQRFIVSWLENETNDIPALATTCSPTP